MEPQPRDAGGILRKGGVTADVLACIAAKTDPNPMIATTTGIADLISHCQEHP